VYEPYPSEPSTKQRLKRSHVVPNLTLRGLIEDWLDLERVGIGSYSRQLTVCHRSVVYHQLYIYPTSRSVIHLVDDVASNFCLALGSGQKDGGRGRKGQWEIGRAGAGQREFATCAPRDRDARHCRQRSGHRCGAGRKPSLPLRRAERPNVGTVVRPRALTGRAWHSFAATSLTRFCDPCVFCCMVYYDVASNICQACCLHVIKLVQNPRSWHLMVSRHAACGSCQSLAADRAGEYVCHVEGSCGAGSERGGATVERLPGEVWAAAASMGRGCVAWR
jgi:hypothetical protein